MAATGDDAVTKVEMGDAGAGAGTEAKQAPFPLTPALLTLLALTIWCTVLAVAMQPGQGFGFATAWEYGTVWGFGLGLLIALQGFGKIINPRPYFEGVDAFRIPVPAYVIGGFFIVVELYSGPAMCMGALFADSGALVVVAAVGSILDIAGYVTLSLSAYLRGLAFRWNFACDREDGKCVENCTCFGVYGAQKLSVWVLLQDVIVVLETAFVAARIFSNSCSIHDNVV